MKQILIVLLVFIGGTCFGQIKHYYHEFYETASDVHISKWNIDKDNLPTTYVQESVDNKNRVVGLKFFKNQTLEYVQLCFLSVWIKYEYPNDTTIIEYYLDSNGEENANIECGMPSKTIFTLSKDKKNIIETKSEYNLDKEFYLKNGWIEEDLNALIVSLNAEERTDLVVSYYSHSFYKMSKIYPISSEFQIDKLLFSDKEKEEILKSLN